MKNKKHLKPPPSFRATSWIDNFFNIPKTTQHLPNVHVAVSGSVSTWRSTKCSDLQPRGGKDLQGGSKVIICWVWFFPVETNRISMYMRCSNDLYVYYFDDIWCINGSMCVQVRHMFFVDEFSWYYQLTICVEAFQSPWVFVVSLPYSCEPPSISGERSPASRHVAVLQAGCVSWFGCSSLGKIPGKKYPLVK